MCNKIFNNHQQISDSRPTEEKKPVKSEDWRRTALSISVLVLGVLSVVVLAGIGTIGLVHPNGAGLPTSLQWLKPAIETIASTHGNWGSWVMGVGGSVVGIVGIVAGFYYAFHSLKKESAETDHVGDNPNEVTIIQDPTQLAQESNNETENDERSADKTIESEKSESETDHVGDNPNKVTIIQDPTQLAPKSNNETENDELSASEIEAKYISIENLQLPPASGASDAQLPLLQQLEKLSHDYCDLSTMARDLAPSALPPFEIPDITFSDDEQKKMREAKAHVKDLETLLKKKYGVEFDRHAWHGWQSFQRILFQDEKFLQAIQDPFILKIILDNSKNKQETSLANISQNVTLSGLLLFALKGSKILYLATATPCWQRVPECITGAWKYEGMGKAEIKDKEAAGDVRTITASYVQNLSKALATIDNVFSTLCETSKLIDSISAKIANATVANLVMAFFFAVDTAEKAELVTQVPNAMAGKERLSRQSFEVMADFEDMLESHENDYVKVLNYGLISHVLDARHLAAILYYLDHDLDFLDNFSEEKQEQLIKGRQAAQELIKRAGDGSIDEAASLLIKARLQQVLEITYETEKPLMIYLNVQSCSYSNTKAIQTALSAAEANNQAIRYEIETFFHSV